MVVILVIAEGGASDGESDREAKDNGNDGVGANSGVDNCVFVLDNTFLLFLFEILLLLLSLSLIVVVVEVFVLMYVFGKNGIVDRRGGNDTRLAVTLFLLLLLLSVLLLLFLERLLLLLLLIIP